MAFRRVSSQTNNSTSYSYSNSPANPSLSGPPLLRDDQPSPTSTQSPTSPTMRKRQRTMDLHPGAPAPADQHQPPNPQGAPPSVGDDQFINDHDAVDNSGDDEDDDEKPKSDKKAGRRKIKIEFIQDKSRRHITFSKRKAGIMKKAYELSTLTGTQVLLLVVSETGLVYTFTTAKLQPLVTQPEGKNLIQACLNAPHGTLPSSMPVGTPIGRSSGPMNMPGPNTNNLPGGLSISGNPTGSPVKDDEAEGEEDEHRPDKRRRRTSSAAGPSPTSGPNSARGATSPHSPNSTIPPPLSIPQTQGQPQAQPSHPQHPQQPPQISLSPTSTSPSQQHQQVATSPAQYSGGSYGHHPAQPPHHQAPQQHDAMYSSHMMAAGGYSYPGPGGPPSAGPTQQLGGLAAAAAQHNHWPPNQQPQVGQGGHFGGRR
ncbi:hypothetical protein AX16_007971 [Volvariella volvacea WC 439]|nr:hypothetical protein AX16_007971 [Volvariella volvacea WC 439]